MAMATATGSSRVRVRSEEVGHRCFAAITAAKFIGADRQRPW